MELKCLQSKDVWNIFLPSDVSVLAQTGCSQFVHTG